MRIPSSMSLFVAARTKRYQIFDAVVSQLASPLDMMDLKILHPPAFLTTPPVAL